MNNFRFRTAALSYRIAITGEYRFETCTANSTYKV